MEYPLTFQEVTKKHVLTYTIIYNQNTAYEESVLYEYGIDCQLHDHSGHLLSSETIHCVSSDLDTVLELCYTLKRNLVYPVHLKEILDELLTDILPHHTTPLLCA